MLGCPLYAQKRTCSASASMSAKCQERTFADHQSRFPLYSRCCCAAAYWTEPSYYGVKTPSGKMRCPSCNSQNPEDAKFCNACGISLPRRCPACGASNLPTSKFCNECGAPLGQEAPPSFESRGSRPANLSFALSTAVEPQSEGERKMVTALFVDIIGSTEIEQDID